MYIYVLFLSSVWLRFIFDDFENVKSIIQRGMYDEATIAESILQKGRTQVNQGLASVSVRRFESFGFLQTKVIAWEDVGVKPDLDENGRQRLDIWYEYSCPAFPEFKATIRHLDGSFTLDDLLGFNNTGNVCVWPSEEILLYYCLKYKDYFKDKRVIELGGGMTCMAGIALAIGGEPTEVMLTDGNEQSMQNVNVSLKQNRNSFNNTEVSAMVLRWNEEEKLGSMVGHYDCVICADCLFFDEFRKDLCSILLKLLKPGGEVIILAPSRNGTFWKFKEIVAEKFALIVTEEKYDDVIWKSHLKNKEKGADSYDENIHYPMLMKLKKSL
ncbi:hypothetical protein CAPTEDRAFT_212855 [Capitella teleta]|uniref:Calmodulin-lysine N-methyltransferase n=1 Tax=Capitella teleta TaxID=283909 RepID=R7UXC9_CAPTE|nr:hypothetical protein CAPTEDRAFT_212855 [Capitella teleta]|eukprot:ELU11228.1 hypothetical protein CAPTEDRAFT_212855 [Capitella teleta]